MWNDEPVSSNSPEFHHQQKKIVMHLQSIITHGKKLRILWYERILNIYNVS